MAEGQYKKEDIDVSEQSKPCFNLYFSLVIRHS